MSRSEVLETPAIDVGGCPYDDQLNPQRDSLVGEVIVFEPSPPIEMLARDSPSNSQEYADGYSDLHPPAKVFPFPFYKSLDAFQPHLLSPRQRAARAVKEGLLDEQQAKKVNRTKDPEERDFGKGGGKGRGNVRKAHRQIVMEAQEDGRLDALTAEQREVLFERYLSGNVIPSRSLIAGGMKTDEETVAVIESKGVDALANQKKIDIRHMTTADRRRIVGREAYKRELVPLE